MSKAREQLAADVFFALGDATRLSVVRKLGAGGALSATALSDGAKVTRQAIVKHLRVLETKVSFAPITTRRHFPGRHRMDVIVNGSAYPLGEFAVK